MSTPIQKTALLAWFLWILAIVCETASIVLRIHIDTLLLRNVQVQLKWLMHMGVISVAAALPYLISSFVPVSPYIPLLLGAVSLAGVDIGIPVAIGIAMLRHRLYDIDIIIHRTLVYSTLTVVLATVYEVSIFTLQSFTGGLGLIRGNQLAIVASTFLIGGPVQASA